MTYTSKHPDYEHQTRAKNTARGRRAFAHLMEYGTGKSKVEIDLWGEMVDAGELSDLLIVAPAGMYRNWSDDSPEKTSQITEHLNPELRERTLVMPWLSRGGKTYRDSLAKFLDSPRDRPRVFVVNVEALSSVERAREACRLFLARRRAKMDVDEATVIKGVDSNRSEACVDLGKLALYRGIMTGLVTPRSPLDLYAQFEFLDWKILGFKNYFTFKMRYAILEKSHVGTVEDHRAAERGESNGLRAIRQIVGYRNVPELHDKIAPHSFRCLKEDCLDLPPKVYSPPRDVELTVEQDRIYGEMLAQATSEIEVGKDNWMVAQSVIVRMLRLHQLCCGWAVDDEKNEHEVPSNRIKDLMTVLGEHGGKAIIWCHYRRGIQLIYDAICKEYGPGVVAQYHGGNVATRGEEERRWLGDADCRFMISSGAGARGNTWIDATLCYYFANSGDLEQRLNSEDRAHRAGQAKSVVYVDPVARRRNGGQTVDWKMVQSFRKKLDMATVINGDTYRSWLI